MVVEGRAGMSGEKPACHRQEVGVEGWRGGEEEGEEVGGYEGRVGGKKMGLILEHLLYQFYHPALWSLELSGKDSDLIMLSGTETPLNAVICMSSLIKITHQSCIILGKL